MRHRQYRVWLAGALIVVAAAAALGANIHFTRGPTFEDQGLTLLMSGKLAGLGNGDLTIILEATGVPTVDCVNPGGHRPPGQNPGEITVSGAQSLPAASIKNGNVTVNVVTQPPPDPDPVEAGCPNKNWDAVITAMEFTSATVSVVQGGEVTTFGPFDL